MVAWEITCKTGTGPRCRDKARSARRSAGLQAVFANGLGGQHIIIVRDLSLVIVTTGGNFDKPGGFLLRVIDEYIIKSVN